MKTIKTTFFSVLTASCSLVGTSNHVSNWRVLEGAESISCEKWPLMEKDLGLTDLFVLKSDLGPELIAEVVKRDARKAYRYYPFKGDIDISKGDLKELSIGQSKPLKGDVIGAGSNLALLRTINGNKKQVELRAVAENAVVSSVEINPKGYTSGAAYNTPKGLWVLLKDEDYDLNYYRVRHETSLLENKKDIDETFTNEPSFLASLKDESLLAVEMDKLAHDDVKFKYTILNGYDRSAVRKNMDLSLNGPIESWAVAGSAERALLVYVEGDSMVGESDLNIVSLENNKGVLQVQWQKKFPLPDVHISDPVLVKTTKGYKIYLLKWLDNESTLASYEVKGREVKSSKPQGVFPETTVLIDAFNYGTSEERVFGVFRSKNDHGWRYSLCKFRS